MYKIYLSSPFLSTAKVALIQHFVIISILTGVLVSSNEFGPPILSRVHPSSLSSTQYPLESKAGGVEEIISLEDFPNYATVMPMAEGRSWIKSEELVDLLKHSRNEGVISFSVTPPPGYGIMAVIQELQIPAFNTFNRSVLIVDESGKIMECFSKFVFQIEGKSPVEVCGRTNDQILSSRSVIDGVGPRSFVVPVGKSIAVKFIYRDKAIDQSLTLSKQVPFYDMGYLFRASIAFTSYKACPHGPPFEDGSGEKLWPCDIPLSSREPVAACIREDLFCDSVLNCGMHDSKEFAVDEKFCKEKLTSSTISNDSDDASTSLFPHRKHALLDTTRLEEAIRRRMLHNFNRPFGYNDMVIQLGSHSGKLSSFTSEPTDKSDALGHPAFVALIILITIICVLIIGLIFRYCCNPCVGKSDPFGDSSNPEAVARFHENLHGRDNLPNGQPARTYEVSFENLFKPVDDSPPSYDDLFPQDVTHLNTLNNHKVYTISTSLPQQRNSGDEDVEAGVRPNENFPSSIYAIPATLVTTQETSRSTPLLHTNNDNQSYLPSPTVVQVVQELPENGELNSARTVNDFNRDEDDNLQRTNHQSSSPRIVDSLRRSS